MLYSLCPVILRWLVDAHVADAAISGVLIGEEEVEVRPDRVPSSCLDENVCMESCRKYFTKDAWIAVENVVCAIRSNPVWNCITCNKQIHSEEQSIACDSCLLWYHFSCATLKQTPKSHIWFCKSCCSMKTA